jgi:hypothetical protein
MLSMAASWTALPRLLCGLVSAVRMSNKRAALRKSAGACRHCAAVTAGISRSDGATHCNRPAVHAALTSSVIRR